MLIFIAWTARDSTGVDTSGVMPTDLTLAEATGVLNTLQSTSESIEYSLVDAIHAPVAPLSEKIMKDLAVEDTRRGWE